jgi:hypothetical protein
MTTSADFSFNGRPTWADAGKAGIGGGELNSSGG